MCNMGLRFEHLPSTVYHPRRDSIATVVLFSVVSVLGVCVFVNAIAPFEIPSLIIIVRQHTDARY